MLKNLSTSNSQYLISSPMSKITKRGQDCVNEGPDNLSVDSVIDLGRINVDLRWLNINPVDIDVSEEHRVLICFKDFWFDPFVPQSRIDDIFKFINRNKHTVVVAIVNTNEGLNFSHIDMVKGIVESQGTDNDQGFYTERLLILTADVHREQWFRKTFHEFGVNINVANSIPIYIHSGVCSNPNHGFNHEYASKKSWLEQNKLNFSHRFSLGNNTPKPHRTGLYFKLWEKQLLDKICHTYNLASALQNTLEEDPRNHVQGILDQYMDYHYSQPHIWPALSEGFIEWFTENVPVRSQEDLAFDATANLPIHDYPRSLTNCPIHLVTETLTESDHDPYEDTETCTRIDWLAFVKLTEKTFRPIQNHRAFMIQGQYGSYEKLHDLGYRTFSDFWDEQGLQHKSLDRRMNTIVKNVEKISDMSSESFLSMYSEMQEILTHNQLLSELHVAREHAEQLDMTHRIYKLFDRK